MGEAKSPDSKLKFHFDRVEGVILDENIDLDPRTFGGDEIVKTGVEIDGEVEKTLYGVDIRLVRLDEGSLV